MTITNEINTLRHYYVVFGRLKVQSYNYTRAGASRFYLFKTTSCFGLLACLQSSYFQSKMR